MAKLHKLKIIWCLSSNMGRAITNAKNSLKEHQKAIVTLLAEIAVEEYFAQLEIERSALSGQSITIEEKRYDKRTKHPAKSQRNPKGEQ